MGLSVEKGVEAEGKSPSVVKKLMGTAVVLAVAVGGLIVHGNNLKYETNAAVATATPAHAQHEQQVRVSHSPAFVKQIQETGGYQLSAASDGGRQTVYPDHQNNKYIEYAKADSVTLYQAEGSIYANVSVSFKVDNDAFNQKVDEVATVHMKDTGIDALAKIGEQTAMSRMKSLDEDLKAAVIGYHEDGFSFKVKTDKNGSIDRAALERGIQRGMDTAMNRINSIIEYGASANMHYSLSGTSLKANLAKLADKGVQVAKTSLDSTSEHALSVVQAELNGAHHNSQLAMR